MNLEFKNFIYLDEQEAKEILELRNQSYIKENMINSENISLENHLNFINSLKTLEDRRYFAIFEENKIVGSLYFTKDEELSWGLYFANDVNPVIKSVSCYRFLDYLFDRFSVDLESFVRLENKIAIDFNKNFGFKVFNTDAEFVYMRLSHDDWIEQKSKKLLKPIVRYVEKVEFIFEDEV